jgi:hypothetical protein
VRRYLMIGVGCAIAAGCEAQESATDILRDMWKREHELHLERECIETNRPATWANTPGAVEYECGATISAAPPSGRPLPTPERIAALRALHAAQQAVADTAPISADIAEISADLGSLGVVSDVEDEIVSADGCIHFADVAATVVCPEPKSE